MSELETTRNRLPQWKCSSLTTGTTTTTITTTTLSLSVVVAATAASTTVAARVSMTIPSTATTAILTSIAPTSSTHCVVPITATTTTIGRGVTINVTLFPDRVSPRKADKDDDNFERDGTGDQKAGLLSYSDSQTYSPVTATTTYFRYGFFFAKSAAIARRDGLRPLTDFLFWALLLVILDIPKCGPVVTWARPLHPPPPVDGMLQKRTEQLIGQLSHYELVIPTLVNRKGEFLSYNLEISGDEHEPSTTNRKKRQIFQGPGSGHFWSNYYIHDRVFYKLSAYGNDFHFNLTLNKKLVSSNFVVEYWDKYGVKKQHFDVHRCHFEGFSYQPYKSEAALSNCHGLQGVFTTAEDNYFVEPLWNHTNDVEREGYPHIVYKKSALKLPGGAAHCGVKGQVAKLYHDVSIGNAVNIIVTRLVLLTDEQPNLSITHHADRSLGSFCRWQKMINSPIHSNVTQQNRGIAHHDNAVLLTRYDICTYKNKPCATLGLAPVAGMCEEERSCSINEDIGLASAYTIAHEMGHNFGMQHDGAGNLCGTPGHERAKIMAAHLTKETTPFLWSSCSREYITNFLDSRRGYCLEDAPKEKDFEFTDELPGRNHNVDEQCKLQFFSKSTECKPLEVCQQLWCLNSSGKCVTNGIPAADGSECQMPRRRKKGYCYRGQCVKEDFRPQSVNGGWSEWTSWTNCSRMCNGGVESSEKHCNNPKPKHGGRYCIGRRKKYRSCNTHDCPAGETDFREIQCTSYNNVPFRGRYYTWKPFTGSHVKPCALNCLANGYNFYTERAPKVIDGTRCFPDKLDICINGECWNVGCDHVLGSAAKEDKCRVCGGDGSTCKTISGTFDQILTQGDYHEVVRIPRGAMNIRIAEKAESKNYLALKNEGSVYYINGGWTIDWPRKFAVAGTIVHYDRHNDEPESFYALGPIQENFVVMVLLQEENTGITYEYNVPFEANKTSHDVTKYSWKHSNWSECSKTCGKGQSVATPMCRMEANGIPVNEALCSPQPKPGQLNQWCNLQPCPPQWQTGNWTECSQSCGAGGIRKRSVICIQFIDDNEQVILEDKDCANTQVPPQSQESCNHKVCPPIWLAWEWSECVPKCGRNRLKTREVRCVSSSSRRNLDESMCDSKTRLPSQAWCEINNCEQAHWDRGPWSLCSVSCGPGKKHRTVKCRTSTGSPSNKCARRRKPPSVQECNTPCPHTEENKEGTEECVDKYHVAYCPLVVQSQYCNRPYFQRLCCRACQLAQNSNH
eukprot:XP_014777450.1 PREDICTED: A disintegrin and metalloproteinase with thrombospondin motifs 6-like [Octopus bimaculoides]